MFAWMGDTGGYFAGKSIGGPKLYPAVSPNKTWSGRRRRARGLHARRVLAHFTFLPTFSLVPGVLVAPSRAPSVRSATSRSRC
jgi:predicted CDP-diglyceride synthetase/phosphatidate cytidylyltransferase